MTGQPQATATVILSRAKDPSEFTPHSRENKNTLGFFTSFRMTR